MLPNKLSLPSIRLVSVLVSEPVLGSNWTPCRPFDGGLRTSQAICAYLNSSPGILGMLGGRDNRKPVYPQLSLASQREIPVPRFAGQPDARDVLAAAYDKLKNETLLPLPQMNNDPIRKQLDDAVTEALGLDPEWVAKVRSELSKEPSITNRRYGEG